MLHVKRWSVCRTWGNENVCMFPYTLHHKVLVDCVSISGTKVFLCARQAERKEREIEEERQRVSDRAITQTFGTDILFSSQPELDVSVPLICYCWAEALVADHCENCEAQGTAVYWVTAAKHIAETHWSSEFPEPITAQCWPWDVNERRIFRKANRNCTRPSTPSHPVATLFEPHLALGVGNLAQKKYHNLFNHHTTM